MIGVDTNILLCLATRDDANQVATIKRWLALNAEGEPLHVNHVVLAEAVWTLKSVYRAERGRIARFIDALLVNADFDIEDPARVEEALQSYLAGGADDSDPHGDRG